MMMVMVIVNLVVQGTRRQEDNMKVGPRWSELWWRLGLSWIWWWIWKTRGQSQDEGRCKATTTIEKVVVAMKDPKHRTEVKAAISIHRWTPPLKAPEKSPPRNIRLGTALLSNDMKIALGSALRWEKIFCFQSFDTDNAIELDNALYFSVNIGQR